MRLIIRFAAILVFASALAAGMLTSPGSSSAQTGTVTAPAGTPTVIPGTPVPPTRVVLPVEVYRVPGSVTAYYGISPTTCGQATVTGTEDAVIQLTGNCQAPGTSVYLRDSVGALIAMAMTPATASGGTVVATAPRPPATGSGGLVDDGSAGGLPFAVMLVAGAGAVAVAARWRVSVTG